MFKKIAIMIIICFVPTSVFAALAMGNKANFATAWPTIEYETSYSVSVGVHDERPYIIDGQKSPTYVGTMRSQWGVPWNMNTQSDKPLSDDIASAIVSGFMRVGIKASAVPLLFSDDQNNAIEKLKKLRAKRIVIITLNEWKIDILRSAGFFIYATIRVYDEEGNELANSSVSHEKVGSGDGSVMSTDYAARSYLNMLLNDEKIKTALGGSSVFVVKEIGRDDRFIAYNNGTVLDTKTNLMWANRDSGANINWKSAKNYCASYRSGGYTDWRTPTKDELIGLYDSSKSKASACDSNQNISVITKLINISCSYLWASDITHSTFRADTVATINFNDGKLYWYNWSSGADYFRVLPVRSAAIKKPAISPQTDLETKEKSSDSSEYAQKLRELKKLKDEGFLTDKEYEQKRKAVVDGL